MKLLLALCFTTTMPAQTWAPQTSNTRASLRGVSAVDAHTVWASGSGAYNAMSFVPGGDGWAVGPQGRIARFQPPANE